LPFLVSALAALTKSSAVQPAAGTGTPAALNASALYSMISGPKSYGMATCFPPACSPVMIEDSKSPEFTPYFAIRSFSGTRASANSGARRLCIPVMHSAWPAATSAVSLVKWSANDDVENLTVTFGYLAVTNCPTCCHASTSACELDHMLHVMVTGFFEPPPAEPPSEEEQPAAATTAATASRAIAQRVRVLDVFGCMAGLLVVERALHQRSLGRAG
jgi:hypothetical protein